MLPRKTLMLSVIGAGAGRWKERRTYKNVGGCQLRGRKSEIFGQGGNKYILVASKNIIKEVRVETEWG